MSLDSCPNSYLKNYLHPSLTYLTPLYTLEPLRHRNVSLLKIKPNYFFPENLKITYWDSARQAIKYLLNYVDQPVDTISIATTTQSNYLSSCLAEVSLKKITRTKNQDSKWDIFAADFGYENRNYSNEAHIYDDAWSFSLDVANNFILNGGKHYVSSLPKIAGLMQGAILVSDPNCTYVDKVAINKSTEKLESLTIEFLNEYENIVDVRLRNLERLKLNLTPTFKFGMSDFSSKFPGVGVFTALKQFDEVGFKKILQNHGIRGTSFFGNNGIILPIHQMLQENDIDFISEVVLHCIEMCY